METITPHNHALKPSPPLIQPRRERNEDGKSLKNPQHGILSKAYDEFPDPLAKDRRGGFDIHIYHFQVSFSIYLHIHVLGSCDVATILTHEIFQNNPDQVAYAKALWERIRRECMPPFP